MAYRVLKPIPKGDGSSIPAGELVDASKWRNLRTLISGRYLVEVSEPVQQVKAKPEPKVEVVATPVAVDDATVVEVKQMPRAKKVKSNVHQ